MATSDDTEIIWLLNNSGRDFLKSYEAYFIIVYWSFNPLIDAILSFPVERPIMMKERAAGYYRLSAYYIAKSISELPLIIAMPIIYITISYWMAGLKGVPEYFATLAIILASTLNAQGFGFVIGSAFRKIQMAMTTSSTFMLCSLIFGGFYSQQFPSWLTWLKYFSLIHYPFGAFAYLELADTPEIPCSNVTVIDFPRCGTNTTDTVTLKMLLEKSTFTIPFHCYVSSLLIMLFGVRIIAYYALRLTTRQKYL